MTPEEHELLEEIAARAKRTETRVARWMEAHGMDVNPVLPIFRGNAVHVPTDMCSIASILKALPQTRAQGQFYEVRLNQKAVCLVAPPFVTTTLTRRGGA